MKCVGKLSADPLCYLALTHAQALVASELGPQFVEPPSFNLRDSFERTDATTPIVFLLSPGSDPSHAFFVFAEEVSKLHRLW